MSTPIDYFDAELLRRNLKAKTVRGGLVTALSQVTGIGVGLASLPVLSRLLDPEDFGLVAMVAVVTGFAAMFVDAGLAMATIQREEITRQQVTNLFWIASGLGTLISILVAAASPLISWFYDEPRLTPIVLAISFSFLLSGVAVQHQALLRRGMQFNRLAIVTVAAHVASQAAAIGWAWWHRGTDTDYWALVLIPLVMPGVRFVLSWLLCPWRPGLPRRGKGTRAMIEFGANLTGFNFANYFMRNADNLLIGWWWGAAPLGLYSQAYRIFQAPMRAVQGPLMGVMIPAFSRLNNDRKRMERVYEQVLTAVMLSTAPVIVMIAANPNLWVTVILGEQWAAAAEVLRWLSAVALTQLFMNTVGWLYISQGKTGEMLQTVFFQGPVIIASFLLGLPWGATGVAAAYAILGLLIQFPLLLWLLRRHDVLDLAVVARLAKKTAPAACAVFACNLLLAAAAPASSELVLAALCVLVSVFVLIATIAFHRQSRLAFLEVYSLIKDR